jgi:hypothetical protein
LNNGLTLVIEAKARTILKSRKNAVPWKIWITTVTSLKEYGEWCSAISFNVDGIIERCLDV